MSKQQSHPNPPLVGEGADTLPLKDHAKAEVSVLPPNRVPSGREGGKVKLATVWLDGCSGCHMSFLDINERILELMEYAELVYSPLVDAKEFPAMVDVTLIEGAVSSEEDLHKIQHVRDHTRILVSLGDCAVTANVPAMRNPFGAKAVLERAYFENAQRQQQIPDQVIPRLLPESRPVHEVVHVDVFVPGCPPHYDAIWYVLTELVAGRKPDLAGKTRFGK